jgi:hypothetical protein
MALYETCEAHSESNEEGREETNHGEKNNNEQRPAKEMPFPASDRLPLQEYVSGVFKVTKSPRKHLIENASPPNPSGKQLLPDIAILRAYICRNRVEYPSYSGLQALVNT